MCPNKPAQNYQGRVKAQKSTSNIYYAGNVDQNKTKNESPVATVYTAINVR